MISSHNPRSTNSRTVTEETSNMTRLGRFLSISNLRFAAGEAVRDQAAQGRREGSVLRTRPTEDAEMRRVTGGRSAVRRLALVTALASFACLLAAGPAAAASPQWTISAVSTPTNLSPTAKPGEDRFLVSLTNTGTAYAGCTKAQYEAELAVVHGQHEIPLLCPENSPVSNSVSLTEVLPAGISLDPAGAKGENPLAKYQFASAGQGFSCALASCTYTGLVAPDQTLVFSFPLDVSASEGETLTNLIRVSGGGPPSAFEEVPTTVSSQPAGFGMAPGAATTALSSNEAGSHPDITNSFAFDTANAKGSPAAATKDLHYLLPVGFSTDFAATPECSAAKFLATECPPASQVGVTTVELLSEGGEIKHEIEPVYNLTPDAGNLAALGFNIGNAFNTIGEISLQPHSYRPEVSFANINSAILSVLGGSLTVWGNPAASIHDPLRAYELPGQASFFLGTSSNATPTPYFTNPTSCTQGPLHSEFRIDSWEEPGTKVPATTSYGPISGCDSLTLSPSLQVQPTTEDAETSSGLNVNLELPQRYEEPEGQVASNLDTTKVTLPAGMSLNPSAGSGLGSCTEEELSYEETHPEPQPGHGCPNQSKIGTVRVHSPVLGEEATPQTSSLFIAKPGENPFHSLLALYLVARIPARGIVVTAAGHVEANPQTGQLTTTFSESPQLPFDRFTLEFTQGATSPLVTPPACGSFLTEGILTPWAAPGREYPVGSKFAIKHGIGGGECPAGGVPPFHPGLSAGSYSNRAGAYSPFYIELERHDGEQEITHFSIKLPPGLIGKLAGVPYCPQAGIEQAEHRDHEGGGAEEEASPSCPKGSEVGHTLVEAGVGATLAQAPGHIYLAGPFHGDQLSVVSITAAKVGPFDLGTVVVRDGLKINPETGEVFVDAQGSDPIPHIIDGIPTHLRTIRIYMDRPEFVLNPTSCAQTSTASTVLGSGKDFVSEADDQPVTVSSFYQAANCSSLPYKPALKLSLKGSTKRGGTPAFKAVLTPRPGDANTGRAQVTLPHSEFLDNAHIGTVCTRVQFNAGAGNGAGCPAASLYGHAKAITPILSEALQGPVYLRSSSHQLPDLVAALHNSQVDFDLVGHVEGVHGGIRNTFETVPDAPVTSFTLEMEGGAKGLLENSTNLCAKANHASAVFTGQNGKVEDFNPLLSVKCGKGGKGKGHHHHKSHRVGTSHR